MLVNHMFCTYTLEGKWIMRILSLTMLAICLLCSSCSKKSEEALPPIPSNAEQSIAFTHDRHLRGEDQWYVCVCTRFENSVEELQFVYFQKGPQDWQDEGRVGLVTGTAENGVDEFFLMQASQVEIVKLPTDTQLYQMLDGELVSSPETVTLGQLKGFLATEPDEYTLESLLEHTRRAQAIKTE